MSWGEISVDISGCELDAEMHYRILVDKLATHFNKKEEDIKEFFGIEEKDMWSQTITFSDVPCYGDANVDKEDIDGYEETDREYQRLMENYGDYRINVAKQLEKLSNWYYIEGGRNDNSKIGKLVESIVKALGL